MARDERLIIEQICNTYAELSPENLTCDGEVKPSVWKPREKELKGRLVILFAELGRNLTELEAYDALENLNP